MIQCVYCKLFKDQDVDMVESQIHPALMVQGEPIPEKTYRNYWHNVEVWLCLICGNTQLRAQDI